MRSALLLALLMVCPLPSRAEGRRPFQAESARLVEPGSVEVELAAAVGWGAVRVLAPEVEGSRLVLPRLGLRTGLGPWGEIRVEGDAWVRFDPDGSGKTAEDAGDWRVGAKVRLGPAGERVRVAAVFVAKLPVASDEEGIGTDETDLEARGLLELARGRSVLDLDLGVAILGDPSAGRSQEDLALYAASWRWRAGPRLELGGGLSGRQGGGSFPARSTARAGMQLRRGSWSFDAALGFGLSRRSPALELLAGAIYRFSRGG